MIRLAQATDAALWQCDICKATGEWVDSWASYGSYAIDDECGHRIATCSETCREHPKAVAMVAGFVAAHPRGRGCKGKWSR